MTTINPTITTDLSSGLVLVEWANLNKANGVALGDDGAPVDISAFKLCRMMTFGTAVNTTELFLTETLEASPTNFVQGTAESISASNPNKMITYDENVLRKFVRPQLGKVGGTTTSSATLTLIMVLKPRI